MKDRRGSIKIDVSLLKNWVETHYNVYARDIVRINGLDNHLVLSVSMNGNFIVSLGADMLYNGDDVAEAIRIFNLDIKGLKDIWIHLESGSRGIVMHPKPKAEKE